MEEKKEENRKARAQIKIRLTEEELKRLKEKIKKSGLSQQDYIKKCALGKEIWNTDGIKEVLPEMKRIGNNLNQIARTMNEGHYPTMEQVSKNQKELNELWQQLRQFLQRHH